MGRHSNNSCNRHSDCEAADERARIHFIKDREKPYKDQNAYLRPYAEHCDDDCCEDCFGA